MTETERFIAMHKAEYAPLVGLLQTLQAVQTQAGAERAETDSGAIVGRVFRGEE